MTNPFRGFSYIIRAFFLLTKPGIRPFVIIPFCVNIIIFSLLIYYGSTYLPPVIEQYLPASAPVFKPLLRILTAIILIVVGFYAFTMVANLISSPFNGLLSEAVEVHLTGKKPQLSQSDWKKMIRELPATLFMEFRKIGYFLGWAIPFILLFFIPGINLIAPFCWILFSAWMLCVEYIDFPLGNHQITFIKQRKLLQQRRFVSLGLGTGCLIMTLTPLLNFFAIPTCVIATTLLCVDDNLI